MPMPLATAPAAAQPANVGQLWLAHETGGYMFAPNLSRYLRIRVQARCRFRQFCDLPEDTQKAKHAGDTFHWNVYGDIPDADGGEILETDTIPHSRLQAAQGKCVVTEFALGVYYSGKLDDLSEHPVRGIIEQALERHCARKLDARAHQQWDKTLLKVGPQGGNSATNIELNATGVATSANAAALSKRHVKAIATMMRERDIPTYRNGDYYSIARPATYEVLESELENVHQYTDAGFKMIMDGEKGRYQGIRFVEQTNIPDSPEFVGGFSGDAFFFGEDCVAECVVVPEEMRGKIPSNDYGRDKGVAYYYLGNFAPTRLDAGDTRVLHWDSA